MMLKKIVSGMLAICTAAVFLFQPVCADGKDNNDGRPDVNYDNRPHLSIQDIHFDQFDKRVNNGEPIKGVDISSVISLEKAGIEFYNARGEKQDIFKTLSENGVNYIRVRIWNEPYTANGESYGGGNCDLYNAAEIGKRAAKYGMKLLADIQYSDFWADPEKQTRPKYWQQHDHDTLKYEIYKYTKWVLETISEAGGDIGMVQVGNETNCFFCGEKDMYKICDLFSFGCKAVREFDPDVMIALHFANPSTGYYDWYAKVLGECKVDYDVFATSYYPYWHGTLQNLTDTLKKIGNTYDKYVMVAETAYPYTNEDGDTFGNAVSEGSAGAELKYEISVKGQAQCLSDVFRAVADMGEKGIGVFYWEPAWIGKSGLSWEEQCRLWKEYGSGWATDFAAEYDKSADKAGGSSYDNQGLFDFNGVPLDSLRVFSHVFPRGGREHTLDDGKYIKDLRVADSENGMDWFIHSGLRPGDRVFGDRDYAFRSVPAALSGAEWISTACDSKGFGDSQAEFTAGEKIIVYVGVDSRITEVPSWLDGWRKTDAVMSDNGNPAVEYQLFRRNFKKGEPVTLGALKNADCVNYFAAVKPVVGDVDSDGELNTADLVMLQSWLIGEGELTDDEAADLCGDDEINIYDLFILKKELLSAL